MLNTRQSQNRRRGRGRGPQSGGPRGNESRIDNRARSNAPQMLEKFKNLAREAQMQGDRVMTEYYLQFADHYFRIVAESKARLEEARPRRDEWQSEDGSDGDMNAADQSAYGLDDDDTSSSDDGDAPDHSERNQRPVRENNREHNRDNNRENGRDVNRERPERTERAGRPERAERPERAPQPDRAERTERPERNERPERAERPERSARPRSTGARTERPARKPEFESGDNTAGSGSISIDILPPALGVVADPIQDLDEAPATPRRRVARPKKAAVEAES